MQEQNLTAVNLWPWHCITQMVKAIQIFQLGILSPGDFLLCHCNFELIHVLMDFSNNHEYSMVLADQYCPLGVYFFWFTESSNQNHSQTWFTSPNDLAWFEDEVNQPKQVKWFTSLTFKTCSNVGWFDSHLSARPRKLEIDHIHHWAPSAIGNHMMPAFLVDDKNQWSHCQLSWTIIGTTITAGDCSCLAQLIKKCQTMPKIHDQ